MFETAEVGHSIDKETFGQLEPALRKALLDAQFELMQGKKCQVVVIIGGVDGAGKGETVNALTSWMDPRHIEVRGFGEPTDEERAHPPMWRFWRALPPRGKIGIFFGSWYTQPIVDRVTGQCGEAEFVGDLVAINHFERMLADEGALVLKFWLHLSHKAQRKRLHKLEDDPSTRWRVTKRDWKNFKHYNEFKEISARALRETDRAYAPWVIVEGQDARYRNLTVGQTLLNALNARMALDTVPSSVHAALPLPSLDHKHLLGQVDLQQKLAKADYERELEHWQGRLALLTRRAEFKKRCLVAVFEGWDAAGKGGAIRRLTPGLDARHYDISPIAAPTEEERLQPYLWRFWRRLPALGRVGIFDRSWYGRVLVERVEGFCSEADWLRAYSEINDFEEQMVSFGTVVCKFWLHLSPEEQLRRFEERKSLDFKQFKITEEDWRNRDRWPAYEQAVCDMVDRTSTEIAPWTLVAAQDKYFARIKILQTLCEQLERSLG